MSTDQTPALARATEAIEALWPDTPWPGVRELPSAEDEARAAVSAALHDPDDPDWLARFLAEQDGHGNWEVLADVQREPYRRMFADMSTAILGADQ